jgi:peptide/nickel transport system ATP-binding protein/oligopeptide transport system ATP-binding protein
MYAGQPVEIASADDLFARPSHPYTRALMESIPYIDKDTDTLFSIKGTVPDAANYPDGCRFAERCIDYDENICSCTETVALREIDDGHFVRCKRAARELTTG